MSNLYVFVITSWESNEPVILDGYCDGLTPFSLPWRAFASVVVTDEGKFR